MADPTTVRGSLPIYAQHRAALVGALGATVLIAVVLVSLEPKFVLIPIALLGTGFLWWAVCYTWAHPKWLPSPLILIELLTAADFLSGGKRAAFHYGLTAVFCLPLIAAAWRNRSFVRAGFRLYLWYFLWAAVTVTYSLAPAFSTGRLLDALMVFGALSYVVSQIDESEDVTALLMPLLIGCTAVVLLVAFSLVALPSSQTWLLPDEFSDSGGVVRFCGIFDSPNTVGALMLITVGCAAALWSRVSAGTRWLLAALIALSLGLGALADSRTPFVALAVGAGCYLVWKYRGRAVIAVLVLALFAGLAHFRVNGEGYLARGEVTTLTGRTDVWEFALDRIEQRPFLGYGYEVAGAILLSRYFPVWWGPWDEGPHTSLHNGYIDRAVGLGVPALLLWLFIVLRPFYELLRRPEDPWRLKPLVFWIVIPMLLHNMTEVSISDCTGMIGLGFFLTWAMGERARILRREQEQEERRQQQAALPPAIAALTASVAVMFALIAIADPARAQSMHHFPTLPPHAALPSGAKCAAAVGNLSSWEPRPGNYQANHRVPTFVELAAFHLAPLKSRAMPFSDYASVDGKFTGTTDQILRWGACKWGIDEEIVRAEAVVESHWRQDDVGDQSSDTSDCPPGVGFPGAWDGSSCQQSYGIMQMKFRDYGGWPLSKDSTAFNVDFRLAHQRACMNGDIAYLAEKTPPGNYPRYPLGSNDEMLWGCMGDWFSGGWYDAGAIKYIAEVKLALKERPWAKPGF